MPMGIYEYINALFAPSQQCIIHRNMITPTFLWLQMSCSLVNSVSHKTTQVLQYPDQMSRARL